ncbi:MAG: viroporin-like protein [Taraxacum cytorhabdovirus 1]|uniref:Viroporin-like protein n=1 Tax=Taraxacum cytorhabdovirus 1 TaxID=2950880 RepID=A0AAE9MT95_9RHAB|nr:MAG: viroporin-like protein [Taraxacum cytorhabdovirus 1]
MDLIKLESSCSCLICTLTLCILVLSAILSMLKRVDLLWKRKMTKIMTYHHM